MEWLKFSHNWNNKLQCQAFTTIRFWNPAKYKEGAQFQIVLTDTKGAMKTDYGTATVAKVYQISMAQITEYIARMDTGYTAAETKNILRTMYKNKQVHWESQRLALALLVKDKAPEAKQESLF